MTNALNPGEGLVQQAVKVLEVVIESLIPNQTALTNVSSERIRKTCKLIYRTHFTLKREFRRLTFVKFIEEIFTNNSKLICTFLYAYLLPRCLWGHS